MIGRGALEITNTTCTAKIRKKISDFYKKKNVIQSIQQCEVEDLAEAHFCKLCVILRSRALLVVFPH